MTGLTAAVGAFIAGMSYDKVPEAGRHAIVNALTDYAGCVLLGRDDEVVRIVVSHASLAATGEARAAFSDRRAGAADAALINGTAGHANDYDDIGLSFHPSHPSVPMAPAILAEAELLGASGRDVIEAYATGYEAWGEIASRDATSQHVKGWHPTGVFGAIGAAAACARLRRLDAARAAHAVGIAASTSSGLVANFGTMTKPFHAGHAARNGVLAARYAEAGMTAASDALEHDKGLMLALSPKGVVDRTAPPRLGTRWWLETKPIGLKLYPLCYATHRAVEGLMALIAEHDLKPDAIESMVVRTGPNRLIPLVHTAPANALDARFSMEFALAAVAITRRATLAETTDAFVRRPDVQALMRKVQRDLDPAAEPGSFNLEPDDWLTVTLAGGRVLRRKLAAPNDRATSVDRQTLWTKFEDCARSAATPSQTRGLFERLQNLDKLASLAELPVIPWSMRPSTKEAAE